MPSAQTTRPVRPARVPSQRAASAPRAYAAVASMSAQVRLSATTVTDATPSGARPVRPSTRWLPRCAVPDVATAPVWTGTTAITRLGSWGSSMPIRQGSAAGSSVRQVMSPPAERQKSVPSRARNARAARSTAQPLTTPLGSSRVRPSGPGSRTRNAPADSRSARAPSPSTSTTSGGQSARSISPRSSRETTESSR